MSRDRQRRWNRQRGGDQRRNHAQTKAQPERADETRVVENRRKPAQRQPVGRNRDVAERRERDDTDDQQRREDEADEERMEQQRQRTVPGHRVLPPNTAEKRRSMSRFDRYSSTILI